MDNITHSLIGITLARSVRHRTWKDNEASSNDELKFKKAALFTGVLASNLPDVDFIISFFSHQPKWSYLVHHRGITHTWLAVFFFGALAAWMGSRAVGGVHRQEKRSLLFLGWVGAFLHIFGDFWNSYGVHPFSPFYDLWFYGDFIFIIEPFIWLGLIPTAVMTVRKKAWKVFWLGLALFVLGLSFSVPQVPFKIVVGLLIWFFGIGYLQWRVNSVWIPYGALMVVLGSFFLGSGAARTLVRDYFKTQVSSEHIHRLATRPAPGNPFCWKVTTVSGLEDSYIARIGVVSVWPSLFLPEECGISNLRGKTTAPLSGSSLPSGPPLKLNFSWDGEFRGEWRKLEEIRERFCGVQMVSLFTRIPYWKENRKSVYFGDVRYDRNRGLEFAEDEFNSDDECLDWIPGLIPPYLEAWER